eukprot:Rhum_TRINITY_DN15386_c1_g1::Rhum_TRINITY_DN15386_c1_g1_i1::g.153841::m.153841
MDSGDPPPPPDGAAAERPLAAVAAVPSAIAVALCSMSDAASGADRPLETIADTLLNNGLATCTREASEALCTLVGIVRRWHACLAHVEGAATSHLLLFLSTVFDTAAQHSSVPVHVCALSAAAVQLACKALDAHAPARQAAAALLCTVLHPSKPALQPSFASVRLPAVPPCVQKHPDDAPFSHPSSSVPLGAVRAAGVSSAQLYFARAASGGAASLAERLSRWTEGQQSGLLLPGLLAVCTAVTDDALPPVRAALRAAAAGDGSGLRRELLRDCLAACTGTHPSPEGAGRCIDTAHAWVLMCTDDDANVAGGSNGSDHLSYALEVLAAAVSSTDECPATAVAMVADAVGSVPAPLQAGPRRDYKPAVDAALDFPAFAEESATPPPQPSSPAASHQAGADEQEPVQHPLSAEAWRAKLTAPHAVRGGAAQDTVERVLRFVRRAAGGGGGSGDDEASRCDEATARGLGFVTAAMQAAGLALRPAHLSLVLGALRLVSGLPRPSTRLSEATAALLRALFSQQALLPPPERTLRTLAEEPHVLFEASGALRANTPWPILHVASVVLHRSSPCAAADDFIDTLVNGVVLALRAPPSPPPSAQASQAEEESEEAGASSVFGTAVTAFVGLALAEGSAERGDEWCGRLAGALEEAAALGPRKFGMCAQVARLLHVALLPPDGVPQQLLDRRREMRLLPLKETWRPALHTELLSPLRTSAVRSALANVTGRAEAASAAAATAAATPSAAATLALATPAEYTESEPLVFRAQGAAKERLQRVVTCLLHACQRAAVPSALDAGERQGVFDLLLSATYMLWGFADFDGVPDGLAEAAPYADVHCYLLRAQVGTAPLPCLTDVCAVLERLCGDGSFAWTTHTEDIHACLVLLKRCLDARRDGGSSSGSGSSDDGEGPALSAEERRTLLRAAAAAADVLSSAHVWTVHEVLHFLPEDAPEVRAIVECLAGGHCVRASLLRLLVQNNATLDGSGDDAAKVVGASPKSRRFAALVNARTSVDQLSPGDWHEGLSSDAQRLAQAAPPSLAALLCHVSARLVSRPCQSPALFGAARALHTAFSVLRAAAAPEASSGEGGGDGAPAADPRLLRTMVALACAAPYEHLPVVPGASVSHEALELARSIVPHDGRDKLPALCRAWRLQKARRTLEMAAGNETLLPMLVGTLSHMVKWLLTLPALAMPAADSPPQDFGSVVAECGGEAALQEALQPEHLAWTDVITAGVGLLPAAGASPLGHQLLLFATATFEHPVGLPTQRGVLRRLLSNDAERLQALVNGLQTGVEGGDGGGGRDAASVASMCKRWLCSVMAGDEEMRVLCRDCLISGITSCLTSSENCLPYLAACAEVCAGGDESLLFLTVVGALEATLASDEWQKRLGAVLSLLEFVRAALSTITRSDSNGWFTQPARAMAEALVCLKFCNRVLRGSASHSAAAGPLPESLASGPITHPYEKGYGCSFAQTKEEYSMMHWYLCYTAYPAERRGACSWCAEHRHRRRGYDVEYAGCIPAYCDTKGEAPPPACGGEAPPTSGIAPREATDPFVLALFHPPPHVGERFQVSLPAEFALQQADVAAPGLLRLLEGCVRDGAPEAQRLLKGLRGSGGAAGRGAGGMFEGVPWTAQGTARHLIPQEGALALDSAVDGRLEFDAMPHHEINLLQSRVLTRHVAAASLCGWVAVVDRSQCVMICDGAASFPSGLGTRRGDSKPELSVLARNTLRFKLIGMVVHPANGVYLAVYGVHEVTVFVVSGGLIQSQVAPQLSLSSLNGSTHVIHCEWVPGSHTLLAVVTTKFVKVFDLSADVYCPIHNYMLVDDDGKFAAATFAQVDSGVALFALTTHGQLYTHTLEKGDSHDGPYLLTQAVDVRARFGGDSGCSIYYSASMQLLCVGYTNGKAFLAHVKEEDGAVVLCDHLSLPQVSTERTGGSTNHWTECPDAPGVLACIMNDGANVGLVSLDKRRRLLQQEVHELHGSGTHVEGIALARHRPPPGAAAASAAASPTSTQRLRGKPAQPALEGLSLIVSQENGTICSYALDAARTAALQIPLPEGMQGAVEVQRQAVLVAKPVQRKGRRPGGKVSGRADADREREEESEQASSAAAAAAAAAPETQHEALLHGKLLPRGAPMDGVSASTLRAIHAFDAKWGGPPHTASDVPSTVPLNVWEDLTPLAQGAWSITRGVGVSAEDKDKLADGNDATHVAITPLRALSRGPSLDHGGVSPGATPTLSRVSPTNSPPLSPLSSLVGRSPPMGGVSPGARSGSLGDPLAGRSPCPMQLGPGTGDHRPAARFVLQSTNDAVICGIRLRLSCGPAGTAPAAPAPAAASSPAPPAAVRSPSGLSAASAPPPVVEDPVVMVRVGCQTRTVVVDSPARWMGFVLTHRESLRTAKPGVEVSVVTNGPEVLLRQLELFTCAAPKMRAEERAVEMERDGEHQRERPRGREPLSPTTSASSALDAILQNLVGGRLGLAAGMQRRALDMEAAAASAAAAAAIPPPFSVLQPSLPKPAAVAAAASSTPGSSSSASLA